MKRYVSLVLIIAMLLTTMVSLSVSSASYIVGDVDGDGKISALDVNCMVRAMSGLYTVGDERSADINGDGAFGTIDVNLLLKYMVGVYTIVQPEDEEEPEVLADISLYSVVYPENATDYELYSAELLCDYISDRCDIDLPMKDDSEKESDYEILVGNTSREESVTTARLGDYSYIFKAVDNKIVIKGSGAYVGCGVGDLTYDCIKGTQFVISDIPTKEEAKNYSPRDAKNVMLLIGDGMGDVQIDFSLMWAGRANFSGDYTFDSFAAKSMPNYGHATTYCLTTGTDGNGNYYRRTTDSAAAGTALACATKTSQGKLGQWAYPVELSAPNIVEILAEKGLSCGVMSTEGRTGGTPAAFTAHTTSRANSKEIIADQDALLADGTLDVLCCGCYDDILEHTKTTVDTLAENENGFFLMVEEAYIDKACHNLNDTYTRNDLTYFVYRFDTFIKYCMTFAACRPDTVLVVTADHETGALTDKGVTTSNGYHTNKDVPVFAMGKGTEIFNDTTVDNTDIPKFFASLFGIAEMGHSYNNIDYSVDVLPYK